MDKGTLFLSNNLLITSEFKVDIDDGYIKITAGSAGARTIQHIDDSYIVKNKEQFIKLVDYIGYALQDAEIVERSENGR